MILKCIFCKSSFIVEYLRGRFIAIGVRTILFIISPQQSSMECRTVGKTCWRVVRKQYLLVTSSNGNISPLLALCAGNSSVTGEFPLQRPVTRSFDVFLDLCLNKRLSKQSRGWWYETPLGTLWRHCNVLPKQRMFTDARHRSHNASQKMWSYFALCCHFTHTLQDQLIGTGAIIQPVSMSNDKGYGIWPRVYIFCKDNATIE